MIKKNIEIAEHDQKANGFNPIQDDGGRGGVCVCVAKMPPTSFFPITSTNVGLSPSA